MDTEEILGLYRLTRLGMEVWVIRLGARELHSFLCERHARTRFERIRQQYTTLIGG